MTELENFREPERAEIQPALWQGENHPLAPPRLESAAAPASVSDASSELPAPVQQAIESGSPIRFSTGAENAEAGREPDYFLNSEGQLVSNPKATPSPDGSINIEME
ncbi:MAG: hypothetical protein K8F91_06250, partial [Candidatus Obscuribacterales bacterium]|nr:hypothetical protein [Candidatus Obscuribacterales bacterium]